MTHNAPRARGRPLAPPSTRAVEDGRGILRDVLAECTRRGFALVDVATHQIDQEVRGVAAVAVTLEVQRRPSVDPLAAGLSELPGVLEVTTTDLARDGD